MKFKKTKIITIICLLTSSIVVSGCSFFGLDKGPDPENYYNTYYGEYDFTYYTFKIGENTVEYTQTNGMGTTNNETYEYDYVSASYASLHVSNPKYDDKDAILIYTTSNKDYVITLWVIENTPNNYSFESNEGGFKVTTTKEWIPGGVKITNTYNGTYRYSGNNYVTLRASSQTASFCNNGTLEEYKWIIGTPEYVNHWFKKSVKNNCILLFKENASEAWVFSIEDSNTLILNNQYTYKK